MDPNHVLPTLLGIAWLLPLASFTAIVLFGPRMGKAGIYAAYVATGAILISCVLSVFSLFVVGLPLSETAASHLASGPATAADSTHADGDAGEHGGHEAPATQPVTGDWYALGIFGDLRITIGYYIDGLTLLMFAMVTFIATCIHFYAYGYMHEELHEVTDHEVTTADGHHLHRPGRFHRFFQYLSLFCFSMLGICIAGNVAMVFVFWELVGICSYFLIGFYIERHSASTAANKAFIVNRVGDFGMIIGMMALFGSLGTFAFGDIDRNKDGHIEAAERGLFSIVRPADADHRLIVPDGMVKAVAANQLAVEPEAGEAQLQTWREDVAPGGFGRSAYWLLTIAGLGIFCGCVGKSAQFPLHVWLPDAMEGPTPVSALVHSATMVAAGVYLVGRFYPVFTPEVLLVIALVGCITLFLAATIAIVAKDIKRVLAYSTVSQLGYMMLALGVGGWAAGMFHLVTHAFFKSLLFMCSGSVIHAVHTNDMTQMGGLRHKMPWTAYTMLAGCLAIIGAGVPFSIGLSGHYSKDAILAQALNFSKANPMFSWIFYVAAAGAAITAFYMFRLWFMTFAGEPRDHHRYDHAHESPRVMYMPLVVLSVFAVAVAWNTREFGLTDKEYGLAAYLDSARPLGILNESHGVLMPTLVHPSEHESHTDPFHTPATIAAVSTALGGFTLALLFYGLRVLNAEEVRKQFRPIYEFLWHKWYFDELYNAIFVQPTLFVARRVAEFDKNVIDVIVDGSAKAVVVVSRIDDLIDRFIVDGFVNWFSNWVYSVGIALRSAETGRLRQYVLFIVVGTVGLFLIITFFWSYTLAGPGL